VSKLPAFLVVVAAAVAAGAVALPAGVPIRACDTRIEFDSPLLNAELGKDVHIGPVVFTGLAGDAPRGSVQVRAGGRNYYKRVVGVRAGEPVTVTARGGLRLAYGPGGGSPGHVATSTAVRFESCAADTSRFSGNGTVGQWTAFSGFLVARRFGCYRLDVRRGDRAWHRTISLGAGRC
jgi:hypothetical protein